MADLQKRIASVGGIWRQPVYVRSYAEAARQLLEGALERGSLDAVALPIFYLQRHTVELAIKLLIDGVLDIRELEYQVALPDDDAWRERVEHIPVREESRGHGLHQLICNMKVLLHACAEEHDSAATELTELADIIESFESTHPDRARYARVVAKRDERETGEPSPRKAKNGSRITLPSIPSREVIKLPLGELQDRIDRLFAGPLRCNGLDDSSLLARLELEIAALSQRLYEMSRF